MRKILNKILEVAACLLFVSMILVSLIQIISRYILKSPSVFSEEFLRYSIIWVSMLGMAYAFGKGGHLSITFLKDKLSGKDSIIIEIFFQFIYSLFALSIMILGGINAVKISIYQISPALKIPMGFIYLSLPVSGVIIILYSILNIKDILKNNNNSEVKENGI